MTYCGTSVTETIMIHEDGDPKAGHYIEMSKSAVSSTFFVSCCCYDDWGYEFSMKNPSDYERVKFNIMESIFASESMDELLEMLSEIFEDGFADILIRGEREEVNIDMSEEVVNKFLN